MKGSSYYVPVRLTGIFVNTNVLFPVLKTFHMLKMHALKREKIMLIIILEIVQVKLLKNVKKFAKEIQTARFGHFLTKFVMKKNTKKLFMTRLVLCQVPNIVVSK